VDPQFGGGSLPPGVTSLQSSPLHCLKPGIMDGVRRNLADLLIMNPWKWEQLNFVGYVCFRMMYLTNVFWSSLFDKGSIDLKILETIFSLYGPTARNPLTCACNPTTQVKVDKEVNRAICHVDLKKLHQLAYSPDISSSIIGKHTQYIVYVFRRYGRAN
jgi:hypothetical protein